MKDKIIPAVVLLIALVCTVTVYYMIFDEHSKLFYINVIVACITEAILLSNIPILSNEKWLTFKNVATSIILNFYAIVLFLWTSIYSLFIQDEGDYNILFIGMLVISILFIILLGAVEIGGSFMNKQEQGLRKTTLNKKIFLTNLNMYWADIQDISKDVDLTWKEDSLQKLRMVIDKISIIPSEKLERNPDVISEINLKLNEIKTLLKKISETDMPSDLQLQSTREIELLKNYVIAIKSSL